ncbi:hypothetical protein HMPREF9421_1782 [Streptococcus australis ATCC 700641]|uniref:Uncharacterized protein n=1 Tax=Streptococcus australis ATCC 700641 TaxID=888833 RepID=E7SCE4_9STRE|nr:hypothetical protein HMPREF9421_1782 [Streptococcus australis ATCC 700641]
MLSPLIILLFIHYTLSFCSPQIFSKSCQVNKPTASSLFLKKMI